METAIQKIAALALFVIGLSHTFQPRAWAQFFVYLHKQGKKGALINGFLHFPLGALIIGFHNVWSGIPIILTLLGYGWVVKSTICFVAPKLALRSMSRASVENSNGFVVVGILMLALALLLTYSIVTNSLALDV